MDKEQLEAQRSRLLSHLSDIAEVAERIGQEMEAVAHPRGIAFRSLKPQSGMYIVHTNQGFRARYQHSDGNWYEVDFHRR